MDNGRAERTRGHEVRAAVHTAATTATAATAAAVCALSGACNVQYGAAFEVATWQVAPRDRDGGDCNLPLEINDVEGGAAAAVKRVRHSARCGLESERKRAWRRVHLRWEAARRCQMVRR